MATKRNADEMSRGDDQDPDYEMATPVTSSKRMRLLEQDAKDATVKRIEMIVRKQFDIEMRHKEKEVILIDERIHQARAMLDKLRACIVASYYGNVSSYPSIARGEHSKRGKLDLNHPAIQRVIKQTTSATSSTNVPSATSSTDGDITAGIEDAAGLAALVEETNGDMMLDGSTRPETPQTPMLNGDIAELLSGCSTPDSEKLSLSDSQDAAALLPGPKGPRNTGQNTFGVGPALPAPKPIIPQTSEEDGSRFHVKKRIIVGNVSKYISPENREDSDPSTHKWMVYVRGPHNEPRIDHFVKKIWFFLHPSYRPNDLVEVKEPPFHLTRRGWGEFPIRVQLHFVDPRNKKVDIIHHLKLDRTYTGLQTLGAETIVDVELDRYLFDEAGQPVSRPSTPTVTSVKYKEGCKPEPSSPGANVTMPTTPSPLVGLPDTRAKTPSTPMEQSPAPSPSLQGSRKGTPTPTLEIMLPPSGKAQTVTSAIGSTLGTISIKEQGGAISGVFGTGGIGVTSKTQVKPTVGAQLAVQQQQGGRFVRVMPPLGPITSQAKIVASLASQGSSTTIAKTPASVLTQPSDAGVASSKVAITDGDKTQVSMELGSPPSVTSPTATAVNVAEAAASTSPGKTGALNVRIQEGKLVADVSPTAQLTSSTMKSPQPTIAGAAAAATGTLQTLSQIVSPTGQVQTVTKVSPQQSLASSLASALSPPAKVAAQAGTSTQPKPGSAGGIKVIPTRTTHPTQGPPTSFPLIPNPPPGTQYYITAKSTDPNLQGKVILIPQQVFAQASGQSVLVGSKGGRPGPSQIQGKGGAALKPTPATKSSFLSPSNVLILPQGSIVPPLPPGSIVQIQQVPSPSRSVQQPQPKPRLAVPQKSVSAPALVGARTQAPRVAGVPSGGIIQIQRTTGPSTATKVLSSQLGAAASPAVPTSGISILPEKGTLAKTPSGGVVFVQRSPSTGKLNAQPVTGISVAGQSGIPQKVALAAQLAASSSTLKPGSTVSIIQGAGKPVPAGQTVVLQSPALNLPKLQQVKTIQQTLPRATQPIIIGQAATTSSQIQSQPSQPQQAVTTQAVISPQGKIQLVSVVPEKPATAAEKQPPSVPAATEIPGQTPMPLSHEVTITTSDNQGSPDDGSKNGQEVKTEPMDVEPSESAKPSETESDKPSVKQEVISPVKFELVDKSSIVGNQSELPATSSGTPVDTVSQPTTAVVTSHGLVQVQAPGEIASPAASTPPIKTSPPAQVVVAPVAAPLSASLPLAVSTSTQDTIQIKQEVLSPVKAAVTSSSISSSVTVAPRTFVVPSAPTTLLAPSASATILTPTLSGALLKPIASSAIPGGTIATKLFGTSPSSTILRPTTSTTILGSSTLIAPTLGQQTIIVTSTLPPSTVVGVQTEKEKTQEVEDPLLVELRRRSREGPVSVYGLETMEDLIKAVVEKLPLIHRTRVQNEHPFMATSEEHYYSWNIGKRRAAEWHRAIAIKEVAREAAKRSKKLKDADGWSTKKIMWWCRRHGYTPPDLGTSESRPRQWCNLCGEVEAPQEGEDDAPHSCQAKWLSSSGSIDLYFHDVMKYIERGFMSLQNTSYSTSDEFVKVVQEKQQDLGKVDDDDSDIEIDVISIGTDSRKVKVKKETTEENNRIKCYLPPSEGARLVTDTAQEIGVQYKPVEIADDTYSNVAQEMIIRATRHFLSDLTRDSFATAYGDRKEHRYPTEMLPTHVFKAINRSKTFDFLTNKHLGIPMPDGDEKDKSQD